MQIAFVAAKPGDFVIVVNTERVIQFGIKGDLLCGVNHVGKSKDISNMGLVETNMTMSGDISLDVEQLGARVGLHSNLPYAGS